MILDLIKQIFKIAVLLGPLYLLIYYYRKNSLPREQIILSIVSVLVIIVMTFHPYFSLTYNLSRFYLQLLFFLSLPAILLVSFIFFPLKKYAINVVGVFVILLFIYLSGLIYQFLGGEARMYFNNYGSDYDKFYVHKKEITSAEWLKLNLSKKVTLFMDREANLRIFRVVTRGYNYNVIPALIYKDSYVFGNYANIVKNRTSIYTSEGSTLEFSFPQAFLEKNKNLIYSNGGGKIYR